MRGSDYGTSGALPLSSGTYGSSSAFTLSSGAYGVSGAPNPSSVTPDLTLDGTQTTLLPRVGTRTSADGVSNASPLGSGAYGVSSALPLSSGSYGASSALPASSGAYGVSGALPLSSGAYGASSALPRSSGSDGASITLPPSSCAYWALPLSSGAYGASGALPLSSGSSIKEQQSRRIDTIGGPIETSEELPCVASPRFQQSGRFEVSGGPIETSESVPRISEPKVDHAIPEAYEVRLIVREDVQNVESFKNVYKPVVEVEQKTKEVVLPLRKETVYELDEEVQVDLVKQVAKAQYEDKTKRVRKPVLEAHVKMIEVPVHLQQEEIVELPEVKRVEFTKEVARHSTQILQKEVDKPTTQVHEIVERVPAVTVKEELVEVPQVQEVPLTKEVPVQQIERIDKRVPRPQTEVVVKEEERVFVERQEQGIEIPEKEVIEVIRQVPKIETRYTDKFVKKEIVEIVEKIVEVPTVVREEVIVEVPQVVRQELVKEVVKPIVQYVNKGVPKHEMRYYDKIVDVPLSLQQEVPVEVPQVKDVELVSQIPKPQVDKVEKPIKKITLQVQQRVEEQPVKLLWEVPVKVSEVQLVHCVRQEVKTCMEQRPKDVPVMVPQAVEREEQVPVHLIEEEEVRDVRKQIIEAVREEERGVYNQVVVQVPKTDIKYIQKVVDVNWTSEVGFEMVREKEPAVEVPQEVIDYEIGTHETYEIDIEYGEKKIAGRAATVGRCNWNTNDSNRAAGFRPFASEPGVRAAVGARADALGGALEYSAFDGGIATRETLGGSLTLPAAGSPRPGIGGHGLDGMLSASWNGVISGSNYGVATNGDTSVGQTLGGSLTMPAVGSGRSGLPTDRTQETSGGSLTLPAAGNSRPGIGGNGADGKNAFWDGVISRTTYGVVTNGDAPVGQSLGGSLTMPAVGSGRSGSPTDRTQETLGSSVKTLGASGAYATSGLRTDVAQETVGSSVKTLGASGAYATGGFMDVSSVGVAQRWGSVPPRPPTASVDRLTSTVVGTIQVDATNVPVAQTLGGSVTLPEPTVVGSGRSGLRPDMARETLGGSMRSIGDSGPYATGGFVDVGSVGVAPRWASVPPSRPTASADRLTSTMVGTIYGVATNADAPVAQTLGGSVTLPVVGSGRSGLRTDMAREALGGSVRAIGDSGAYATGGFVDIGSVGVSRNWTSVPRTPTTSMDRLTSTVVCTPPTAGIGGNGLGPQILGGVSGGSELWDGPLGSALTKNRTETTMLRGSLVAV